MSYHGSVDETFLVATPEGRRSRTGNVAAPADPGVTTRVAEFNDPAALDLGIPAGAHGLTTELAERHAGRERAVGRRHARDAGRSPRR